MQVDHEQIAVYVEALFKYHSSGGWISLRSFFDDGREQVHGILPIQSGNRKMIAKMATERAAAAAMHPRSTVFCPPVATFRTREHARSQDIMEGLTLSVDLDAHPRESQAKLEAVLGPATLVTESGGTWVDSDTGEWENNRHLHYRIDRPARSDEEIRKLTEARNLATRLVGGDPSGKSVVHPFRWPGTLHRKNGDAMCRIVDGDLDREINLDEALAALREACPTELRKPNGAYSGNGADWLSPFQDIITGNAYHDPLVRLSAMKVAAGTNPGSVVNELRALMDMSTGPRDDRWQARYNDIPRIIGSAQQKFGQIIEADYTVIGGLIETAKALERTDVGSSVKFKLKTFDELSVQDVTEYTVKNVLPRRGLVVVWGPPKCGKSFWMFDVVMHVAASEFERYRGHRIVHGDVVYLALEGQAGFGNRAEAFRRKFLSQGATVPAFKLCDANLDLIREHRRLVADIAAQSVNPRCVVIDTLNRSLAGSENKDQDMSAYVRAADAIQRAFDCVVIIIHHCGIQGERPRGHTSLTGAADVQISVRKDADGIITVIVELAKDMEEGTKFDLRLEKVELGIDQDGDQKTSCVMADLDPATMLEMITAPGKAPRETDTQRQFREAFANALATAGRTMTVGTASVAAVDSEVVRREFNKHYAAGESDRDKRLDKQRIAFKRQMNAPPAGIKLFVDGNHTWAYREDIGI